ncbi:hypothetical protein DFH09DRAFT_1084410 [Mycena vulgaris]|nr:hypothetical protein DFH09DRAFT_1084410 [Mycena vulgaris]
MSSPIFTSETTAEEVVNAFSEKIQGENVLITGTSLKGIGYETARVIAKHANLVVITGYDLERLKLSEEALKKDVPSAYIRPLVLDLSFLTAVRNWFIPPDEVDTTQASFTPRVVFVSSIAHAVGPGIDLTTVGHPDPKKYNNFEAYFQAKCGNISLQSSCPRDPREKSMRTVCTLEARYTSSGATTADPLLLGVFTNINQKEESEAGLQAYGWAFIYDYDLRINRGSGLLGPDGLPNTEKLTWKTIPQGAATTMVATFDTRLEDKAGEYLIDCVEANTQSAPHS